MISLVFAIFSFVSSLKIPLQLTQSPTTSNVKQVNSLLSKPVEEKITWHIIAKIPIGTPGQEISLLIDNNIYYSWLAGASNYNSHIPYFKASASSSYKNISIPYTLKSNDYIISEIFIGSLSTDNFNISGIMLYDQLFLHVEKFEEENSFTNNGYLGFGYKKIYQNYPNLVENLKAQGQINRAIFSFHINNLENSEEKVMIIGEIAKKYAGDSGIDVHLLKNSSSWTVNMDSVMIDNEVVDKNVTAEFKISSNYLFVPKESAIFMFGNINSCNVSDDALIICVCNDKYYENFPDIVYTLNNTEFVLGPQSYIERDSTKCTLMIKAYNYSTWVFGKIFFDHFYVVYDYDNDKVTIFQETIESSYFYEIIGACAVVIIVIFGIYLILRDRRSRISHEYKALG